MCDIIYVTTCLFWRILCCKCSVLTYMLVTEGPRNRSAGQPLVISDVKKGSIAHRSVTQAAFITFYCLQFAILCILKNATKSCVTLCTVRVILLSLWCMTIVHWLMTCGTQATDHLTPTISVLHCHPHLSSPVLEVCFLDFLLQIPVPGVCGSAMSTVAPA